jgi:hypothetical protein
VSARLLEALHRLWPIFERATKGLVFTADRAGEVTADMNTLRAALAEAEAQPTPGENARNHADRICGAATAPCGNTPYDEGQFTIGEAQRVQEPVAWRYRFNGWAEWAITTDPDRSGLKGAEKEPLYAAPPQRVLRVRPRGRHAGA